VLEVGSGTKFLTNFANPTLWDPFWVTQGTWGRVNQDAMAICRWADCPDAFVTFTCNTQWFEIKRALLLGQQP
jgi:hypothetical protein